MGGRGYQQEIETQNSKFLSFHCRKKQNECMLRDTMETAEEILVLLMSAVLCCNVITSIGGEDFSSVERNYCRIIRRQMPLRT